MEWQGWRSDYYRDKVAERRALSNRERYKIELTRFKNYLIPKIKYWSSCAVTCLVIHVIMEVAGI